MFKCLLPKLLGLKPTLYKTQIHLLFIAFLMTSGHVNAQTPAFPGAEGFGKNASGGRGGTVIKVTNLNSTGTGSLRAALTATGPRTVIFEVGGTIDLQGNDIDIESGNITVAGQTAPGDGILIRNGKIQIEASNVIIRYIRSRSGLGPEEDGIAITAYSGNTVENVILDHCSISWATDGNFDMRGIGSGRVRNITIQHSILSECTKNTLLYESVERVTYYQCLLALNSERNIRTVTNSSVDFAFEMVNNLIYGFRYATQITPNAKFTVLNNKYKASSQVSVQTNNIVEPTGTVTSSSYAYIQGNIVPNGINEYSSSFNSVLQSTPYQSSGIVAVNANQIEQDLLEHVGCSFPSRDSVDNRIVNNWINGDGTTGSIGQYPQISNGTPELDTDNDGMPDQWEIDNGLNPTNISDGNIVQPDGYTNLEYYLNWLTLGTQVSAGDDITICEGASTTLTASGAESYVWSTGETTQSITVSPAATTTYTVIGTHADATVTEDSVTVSVDPVPTANAGNDETICEGESVTLTASGGTSYSWSTGETTQSITVSPNSTTTYTVTVNPDGCEGQDEVTVSVEPLPTANAGNDVTIQLGDSTTLTASGGDSYLWNTGETTQSITVSPDTTTTYTVTVFQGNCQDTDDVIVTVEVNVDAYAGEDVTICEGEETVLTASGGDTYLWNTGETTQSITVSPTEDTIYSVTAFIGNSSDVDDVVVFVNPLPDTYAGEDIMMMQGDTIQLTASGGDTYLWSTGETTQSIFVSPNITTTYTVTAYLNGCEASDDIIVTVTDTINADAGEDQTICEGEEVTLTASGGNAYVWSTGETTSSITVSPVVDTTYTVTVIIGNESATDDVTVFVNPIPNAYAGEDVTINEGDSTVLTASGEGSFEWSTGETTQSITVSPNQDALYTVFVTSVNGCENFDEVNVFVNPAANANAGEDVAICEGFNTVLTASGGDTYLWSTGETTPSITVSPSATTTYTVIVSNEFSSDSDEVTVTVNQQPDVIVSDDVTILQGEFVTLSASGANSYQWSNGAVQANIAVSPSETTIYSVTGYINDCSETEDITVSVVEQVEAYAGEDTTICFGESITLSASGGDSYLWNTGETTQSITVSPSEDTMYTVIVSNELDSDADEVFVMVDNCEIEDIEEDFEDQMYQYELFMDSGDPDLLTIRIQGLEGDTQLLIHDISGRLVHQDILDDHNGEQFERKINTHAFSKGVFIVTLIERRRQSSRKVVFH